MNRARDRTGLEVLPRERCLELLANADVHIGRIGIVDYAGRPLVLPVNYVLDGDAVIFRTDEGTKLDAAARNAHIAFEVDAVDPAWQEGWSVVVQGLGEEVTDAEELERLSHLPLRTWAPGEKRHYIRLPTDSISGRRIS